MTTIRQLLISTLCASLFCCSSGQNFSQYPGFVEHFKQYPPKDSAPTMEEIAQLKQFKPRIFHAKDQRLPIDFYADYISKGELLLDGGKISSQVTRELLNKHRDNPNALFRYRGDYGKSGTPRVYAKFEKEKTVHAGVTYDFSFLSYNLVFPVSGILQGLGPLQSLALAIGGNLNDWHQLDHYVGLSVALLDGKPVAITLQQHNYHTTYLPDTSTAAVAVDIAQRSNELYLHHSEKTKHPAVSFLTADNLEFVMTGNNKPVMAGYDVTNGEAELAYDLEFLPQTDAFYQFKGSLGKNRLLPGRSGPPGADYATLPGMMPRIVRMVTGYRPGPLDDEINMFTELFDQENFSIRPNAINAYQNRFFEAIQ